MADFINHNVPFSNPRTIPLIIEKENTFYATRKNTIEVFTKKAEE